jgi:hypothetical protein
VIRGAGRAIAAAVLGALAGATWLALIYGSSPALNLEFDVTPPREIVQGIYTTERDPGTGRTFVWSADAVTISLGDVDRQVPWTMDIRVRGARPGGQQNPTLQFFVDGMPVQSHDTAADYSDVRVEIPVRPAQSGVVIDLRVSATFIPGPSDRRILGVMLDRLTLTPSGVVLPPRAAFAGVALASAAAGAALALLGATAGSAVGGVLLLSAALAALIARGFGPYTDFPELAARAALWIGGVTAIVAMITRRVRHEPFRNTARFAIAFSASALLLELLVLLHPNMPIGDALFHAHRYQEVLAGRWYFTSTAPGGYQFPYAPGLYLFAIPFSWLVRRGPSDMTLLRTIVTVADALAGLLLYSMAVRVRGDRLAGAMAVALYHLIPLGFGVISIGNLTNAFAQSLSVAGLALMANGAVRFEHRGLLALLTGTLLAAFLSHTSAFAIGAVGACLVAFVFWWRGGPALRSPALAVVLAATLAIVLAVVLYYAHFLDTYRTELSRIGSETSAAAPDASGRSVAGRLTLVLHYLRGYYGVPAFVLAIWGAGALWRRSACDRVTLTCAGWTLACLLFLILGIVTPVDMRHYLAAVPAVALAGALAAAFAWNPPSAWRFAAVVLLAWAVVFGINTWWSTLDVAAR